MKSPFRRLTVVALAWLLGLCAGVVLLFTVGPQMQCAADPSCAKWVRAGGTLRCCSSLHSGPVQSLPFFGYAPMTLLPDINFEVQH